MDGINENSRASIEFCLEWQSREAKHRDCFFAENVNFWRDCFPPDLFAKFEGKQAGETIVLYDGSDIPIGRYLPEKIYQILHKQFNTRYLPDRDIIPRQGRFYPLGMVQGLPGVFKVNTNLCRCIGVKGQKLVMDLNHPLAGYPLTLYGSIMEIHNNILERGGRCEDWIEAITMNGPGLQTRYFGSATDFSDEQAFSRKDESDDRKFYAPARIVHHIDSRARAIVRSIYRKHLQPESLVLDLMGSWDSHLPEVLNLEKLTVLGVNQEELAANRQATARVIHDLNANPTLPFSDQSFDGVICTVSVEYMSRPYEVFREISRVLNPGGVCIMTFSNRWFPPKIVMIWEELHEFERVGLVSDYFLQAETFKDLETQTYRGWPRPEDDKYFGVYPYSDTVYAVIARKE